MKRFFVALFTALFLLTGCSSPSTEQVADIPPTIPPAETPAPTPSNDDMSVLPCQVVVQKTFGVGDTTTTIEHNYSLGGRLGTTARQGPNTRHDYTYTYDTYGWLKDGVKIRTGGEYDGVEDHWFFATDSLGRITRINEIIGLHPEEPLYTHEYSYSPGQIVDTFQMGGVVASRYVFTLDSLDRIVHRQGQTLDHDTGQWSNGQSTNFTWEYGNLVSATDSVGVTWDLEYEGQRLKHVDVRHGEHHMYFAEFQNPEGPECSHIGYDWQFATIYPNAMPNL